MFCNEGKVVLVVLLEILSTTIGSNKTYAPYDDKPSSLNTISK